MSDQEMIDRMRKLAYASIYGGWGDASLAWLLEVAERMEQFVNEQNTSSNT